MEEVVTILSTVLDFWYIALPASVFLMFGARYTTKAIFVVMGFLIGLNVAFPWLSSYEIFQNLIERVETGRYLALIVISLLAGILFYVLYKYLIFAGAFLLTFIPFLLLEKIIVQRFNIVVPNWEWSQYVLPAFVGVLAGYTAYRREEEFSKILSLTVGSLIFSLLSLYGVCRFFGVEITVADLLRNKLLLLVYLLTALLLEFLALRVVFGGWGKYRERDGGTKIVR